MRTLYDEELLTNGPLRIFRLVTAHTVEKTILQKASKKRELEALVIARG